jgi:hypothetical protein
MKELGEVNSGELARWEMQAGGFDYGSACRMVVFAEANRERFQGETLLTLTSV